MYGGFKSVPQVCLCCRPSPYGHFSWMNFRKRMLNINSEASWPETNHRAAPLKPAVSALKGKHGSFLDHSNGWNKLPTSQIHRNIDLAWSFLGQRWLFGHFQFPFILMQLFWQDKRHSIEQVDVLVVAFELYFENMGWLFWELGFLGNFTDQVVFTLILACSVEVWHLGPASLRNLAQWDLQEGLLVTLVVAWWLQKVSQTCFC